MSAAALNLAAKTQQLFCCRAHTSLPLTQRQRKTPNTNTHTHTIHARTPIFEFNHSTKFTDKYATQYRHMLYAEVPHGHLAWAHRRRAIVAELSALMPDVACLQEVDQYHDLKHALEPLGCAFALFEVAACFALLFAFAALLRRGRVANGRQQPGDQQQQPHGIAPSL